MKSPSRQLLSPPFPTKTLLDTKPLSQHDFKIPNKLTGQYFSWKGPKIDTNENFQAGVTIGQLSWKSGSSVWIPSKCFSIGGEGFADSVWLLKCSYHEKLCFGELWYSENGSWMERSPWKAFGSYKKSNTLFWPKWVLWQRVIRPGGSPTLPLTAE